MTDKDPLTNEVFPKKRINQRFACAENRINYHNMKANELRHSVMHVNKPLHTNLRILIELMKNEQEKIFHNQFLLGKGFNFSFSTHITLHENKRHPAVYQYTFVTLMDDKVKIIKNTDK